MRCFVGSILATLGLTALLSGCSAGSAIGGLPGIGLPADAPAAPTRRYPYPAVYDTPPQRRVPALTEEQQTQLKQRLTVIRERQEVRRPAERNQTQLAKSGKKKKRPASAEDSENPGGGTNP